MADRRAGGINWQQQLTTFFAAAAELLVPTVSPERWEQGRKEDGCRQRGRKPRAKPVLLSSLFPSLLQRLEGCAPVFSGRSMPTYIKLAYFISFRFDTNKFYI